MMKALRTISLTVSYVIVAGSIALAQESERIAVYVGPQVHDGFVDIDAGIRDSIKDIQQECMTAGWDCPERC